MSSTCTLYIYMYIVHLHVHCTSTCTLYMYVSGNCIVKQLSLNISSIVVGANKINGNYETQYNNNNNNNNNNSILTIIRQLQMHACSTHRSITWFDMTQNGGSINCQLAQSNSITISQHDKKNNQTKLLKHYVNLNTRTPPRISPENSEPLKHPAVENKPLKVIRC